MTGNVASGRQAWFDGRARLVRCEAMTDARGSLLPLAFDRLPLRPCRVFTVAGVPQGTVRGGHAHRAGEQMLVCIQGCIDVLLRCGEHEARTVLTRGGPGLLVGGGVWCQQTYVDAGSVLLVMASEPYDHNSYVERWDAWV